MNIIKSITLKLFLRFVWIYRSIIQNKIIKYFDKNGFLKLTKIKKEGINLRLFQLYFLHNFIKKNDIATILEFGSGWTTLAMAHAISQSKRKKKLCVIESDEYWLKQTKKIIPKEYYDFIEFLLIKPKLISFNGINCLEYQNLPNFPPELVMVDGPSIDTNYGDINGLSSEKVIKTLAIKNLVDYSYCTDNFIFDTRIDSMKILFKKTIKNFNFYYFFMSKQGLAKKDISFYQFNDKSSISDIFFPSKKFKRQFTFKNKFIFKYFKIND